MQWFVLSLCLMVRAPVIPLSIHHLTLVLCDLLLWPIVPALGCFGNLDRRIISLGLGVLVLLVLLDYFLSLVHYLHFSGQCLNLDLFLRLL